MLFLQEKPVTQIARQFGIPYDDTLLRHRDLHLANDEAEKRRILLDWKRMQEQAVADELNGEIADIKGGLGRIVRELESILNQSKEEGKMKISISALREMRATLETISKAYGSLKTDLTVHVRLTESPEWERLRVILVDVLGKHPAARAEFVERIRYLREAAPGRVLL
jgi:hypothetical protein